MQMQNRLSRAPAASRERIPAILLGDDATSADQIALGVVEILGERVITTDAVSLTHLRQFGDAPKGRVLVFQGLMRAEKPRTRKRSATICLSIVRFMCFFLD